MARKPKIYKTITVDIPQTTFDEFVEQVVQDLLDVDNISVTTESVAANPKVIKAFDQALAEHINEATDYGRELGYGAADEIYSKEIAKANDAALKLAEAEMERVAREGAVIRVPVENEDVARAILLAAGLIKE